MWWKKRLLVEELGACLALVPGGGFLLFFGYAIFSKLEMRSKRPWVYFGG